MAVIKFGSVVTSGRGSLGGSTIQSDRSGHIWRNKPMPTKSRTQAQSIIRGYNKTMQAGWRSLSDQDRKVWNDYAQLHQVCNRSGEKHPLSGHSLWLKYQFDALQKGAPFMPDPSEYPGPYYGPEIVKNGSFDNSDHWLIEPCWSISAGAAHYDDTNIGYLRQNLSLPVNTNFNVRFRIFDCPSVAVLHFHSLFQSGYAFKPPYNGAFFLSNGLYSFFVESARDVFVLTIIGYTSGVLFSFDDLSIRQVFS